MSDAIARAKALEIAEQHREGARHAYKHGEHERAYLRCGEAYQELSLLYAALVAALERLLSRPDLETAHDQARAALKRAKGE